MAADQKLVKPSDVLSAGTDHVEQMRRALNSSYSEVPSELNGVFDAALDQVADQQVNVSLALTSLLNTGNVSEAEQAVKSAIAEAQRAALRAAREYADYQASFVQAAYKELVHIPDNITELLDTKRKIDKEFTRAVKLHEKNEIEALEPLLAVAGDYKEWCSNAWLRVVGSQGMVESNKRRERLQVGAIVVALILGVINIILTLWITFAGNE